MLISYQYCIICHQTLYILSQYGPLVPGLTASGHCCDLLALLLQITLCLVRNWEQIWHSDISLLKMLANETKYLKEFEKVEWWMLLSSLLVVNTEYQRKMMGSTAYLSGAPYFNPDFRRDRYALSLVFCWELFVPFDLFSFGHCIVCPPIYDFGLSLCFLQIVQSHRSIASHGFQIGEPSRWRIVRLSYGKPGRGP